jgi:ubiquitin-conjugating enzyme E2 S
VSFDVGAHHAAQNPSTHLPPPHVCSRTGYFLTKIFHPNVSSSGEICVNVLKRDWSPDLGLRHIFTVIRCLLIEPNPESALNEEAGKLLLESFDDFAKKARLLTDIHARKPTVLTATGGANALNSEAQSGDTKAGPAMKAKLVGRAGVDKKRSLKRL